MRRVVITGMGAVTSCGMGIKPMWERVKEAKHAFYPISSFDTTNFDVKFAAEIQDWDPSEYGINKKEARRTDMFCQYSSVAAKMAIDDAGEFKEGLNPYRVGVLVASGIGGFHSIEEEHKKFVGVNSGRVSVFFIPMMISNMAAGKIAMDHGLKGENYCPVSACASGAHAVGEAFRKIKHGYLDACVTGGTEAAITEFALTGFNTMGALSRATDIDRLSVPFDKERSGFVMGEGAGILVLEEYEHAKKRGAKIYAEVVGYGATDDAFHITSPDPEGEGAANAMIFAMNEAGITADKVDYINAHGTSTDLNDKYETHAIKKALGEHAKSVAISSTKGVTGHLLGAAGAIESIISALALKDETLPPTAGYKVFDEECDLDYITEGARSKKAEYVLSNSLGFGGHNACIAFKRVDEI